jgi:malonyl-CoA O-methyltransferase
MTGMSDAPLTADSTAHADDWLDVRAARLRFERAADSTPAVDALAREVARRMAERLDLVRIEPKRILDAGCGAGADRALLDQRYPRSEVIGVDSAWSVLRQARPPQSMLARARRMISSRGEQVTCADITALPFAPASFSMVWSNLALAWAADPMRAFGELRRVLAPGGLLMFSSYGPDTLKELRAAFSRLDVRPHVHRFIDMHDLGDMLVASGFVTPVMDMEVITLTYQDFDSLARDLRDSGQTNAARGRARGLLGGRAFGQLRAGYELLRRDGRLPATVEIVYGHAWRGEPRTTADGRSVVQLQMRAKSSRASR